jgi:allophanate hydrolase subunit 2
VEPVLGSASTDHRSGFGGFDGQPLRAGDLLRFVGDRGDPLRSVVGSRPDLNERVPLIATSATFGWFAPTAVRVFCAAAWTVAADSDRTGIRLAGGSPVASSMSGIPSVALPVGAVQVPPGGEPIIKMVDGPVTGGYPVLGVIPRTHLARLAQAAPGTILRFRSISVAAARRLAPSADDNPRIELDDGDFAAGWAG